jgi:hypothetical protein
MEVFENSELVQPATEYLEVIRRLEETFEEDEANEDMSASEADQKRM